MNQYKEHINIAYQQARHHPLITATYIALFALISALISSLHYNTYSSSTRILVEETSKFSSILSGHYTPRANIKEEISNLREICHAQDTILKSLISSGIINGWNHNKPSIFKITEKIKNALRIPRSPESETEKLINYSRTKLFFQREENTIVISFTWHNKEEAKLFIESIQNQLIERNKDEQIKKSKDTISILESIKDEIDESISQANSRLIESSSQANMEVSSEIMNKLDILESKKTRLSSLIEKISAYEQKQDEQKIDAEETMRKLRISLGPEHPDLKLALQVSNNKIHDSGYIRAMENETRSLQNEISTIETFLHLNKFINNDKDNISAKNENIINDLRLLSVRRQEIEERIDDAKKTLRSTNNLLANTLTVTVPPSIPIKPSSKTTLQIRILSALLSTIAVFLICYFQGRISDTIHTALILEQRFGLKRL